MVSLKKDKKSECWIIEFTYKEGYHDCIFVTEQECNELRKLLNDSEIPYF